MPFSQKYSSSRYMFLVLDGRMTETCSGYIPRRKLLRRRHSYTPICNTQQDAKPWSKNRVALFKPLQPVLNGCDPAQRSKALTIQSTQMNYGQRTLCHGTEKLDKCFKS
jgi:hypothetical protein